MDYHDSLWDKALDELGKELDVATPKYSIRYSLTGGDQMDLSTSGNLKSHRMLKRLDMHKGTPPEQLKRMAGVVADDAIKMVEDSLGWPKMLNTYDEFEVTVCIRGRQKNASNQSGGTLGKKNASNQSGGTLSDKVKIDSFYDPNDGELDIGPWTPGIM